MKKFINTIVISIIFVLINCVQVEAVYIEKDNIKVVCIQENYIRNVTGVENEFLPKSNVDLENLSKTLREKIDEEKELNYETEDTNNLNQEISEEEIRLEKIAGILSTIAIRLEKFMYFLIDVGPMIVFAVFFGQIIELIDSAYKFYKINSEKKDDDDKK